MGKQIVYEGAKKAECEYICGKKCFGNKDEVEKKLKFHIRNCDFCKGIKQKTNLKIEIIKSINDKVVEIF